MNFITKCFIDYDDTKKEEFYNIIFGPKKSGKTLTSLLLAHIFNGELKENDETKRLRTDRVPIIHNISMTIPKTNWILHIVDMISIDEPGYITQSFKWFPSSSKQQIQCNINSVIVIVTNKNDTTNINEIIKTGEELIRCLSNHSGYIIKNRKKIPIFLIINEIQKEKSLSLSQIYDNLSINKIHKLCSISSTLCVDLCDKNNRLKKLSQCNDWLCSVFKNHLKIKNIYN